MMANQGLTNTLEPLVRSLGLAGGNIEYVGNAALQAQRLVDQNRGAIAGDVETQQQLSQLALLGANNKFISAGVDSVEKGFEYNMKVLGGVVENVLDELNGPLTNFGTVAGSTTQTLNRMDLALRAFTNQISSIVTAIYGTDIAPAALQSASNATLGTMRGLTSLPVSILEGAGFNPRASSANLGIPDAQNAPVPAGSAFQSTDILQPGGILDYISGGSATDFKNSLTDMVSGSSLTNEKLTELNNQSTELNTLMQQLNNKTDDLIAGQKKQITATNNS
jgi:hypothetical protein